MLPHPFRMVAKIMETYGLNLEILDTRGPEIAERGLKYVHNDTCYPAILVIGQLMDAINSGKYDIDKDRFTVLDALAIAGDLTIQGKRENVTVLREEYGSQKAYTLNLNDAAQFHSSPAFYLQQNDIVYVEPNTTKASQSSTNGNTVRSVSFWMSLASLALTIVTFVTRF